MLHLKLHLIERADFSRFYDPNIAGGGLFVPIAEPPAVGSPLMVEVAFQAGPRVLLRGMAQWRRATGDARARPGVGVGFEASERAKLAFLLGYVRGGLLDLRTKKRLPVRLRVAYTSPVGRRVNFTRDINSEGAFVRVAELLEIGTATTLLISPPGDDYKPIEVHATVARHESEGGERGVGVRFTFASEQERIRLFAFLEKLEADYLDGKLPERVLE